MAVIGINYKGGGRLYDDDLKVVGFESPLKYKSVYVYTKGPRGGYKRLTFGSGNFIKDWFNAKKKYTLELQKTDPYLAGSSCVDHFFMDGANYDSAYLHIIDDKPVLKYIDRTKPDRYKSDDVNGSEFFVEEGTTPTWEELKQICCGK